MANPECHQAHVGLGDCLLDRAGEPPPVEGFAHPSSGVSKAMIRPIQSVVFGLMLSLTGCVAYTPGYGYGYGYGYYPYSGGFHPYYGLGYGYYGRGYGHGRRWGGYYRFHPGWSGGWHGGYGRRGGGGWHGGSGWHGGGGWRR